MSDTETGEPLFDHRVTDRQFKAVMMISEELERGNNARQLLHSVAAMRRLQKRYFATRDREVLIQSKQMERKLDKVLEELRLNPHYEEVSDG